jgi:tetratricopeptide (TPR) repeat protein
MRRALKWADCPQSAHWFRRVGSTYLNLGLHDEALVHFNQALPLDGDMVETCGRLAYCYMKNRQYDRALVKHLMCESLEERLIATGRFTTRRERDFSRWRLYTNIFQIAQCYSKLGRIEDSIKYYQKAILSAYDPEKFEPEGAYLEVLAANNQHELIMELLDRLDRQPGKIHGESRLIDFLVEQATGTTDTEWIIPKTVCIRGKIDFMLERYRGAIASATRRQDTATQLNLRLSLASLKYFARNYDGAIDIHDEITEIGGHPRGSVLVRTLHTRSLRSRAQIYKQMIVNAGVASPEADPLFDKLRDLREYQLRNRAQRRDMPQRLVGIDVNDASLYLGLLYNGRGQASEARPLLGAIIAESLAILSDDEPQNDSHALENLSRALVAAGDVGSAAALFQSMRRVVDDGAGSAQPRSVGDSFSSSLSASKSAGRISEPFLPYSRPHPLVCLQCLETLTESSTVFVCATSLDAFCRRCVEGVIKVPGNATADRRQDVVCRSDHTWFAVEPLRTRLARGEILVGGVVERWEEWEERVREMWASQDGFP